MPLSFVQRDLITLSLAALAIGPSITAAQTTYVATTGGSERFTLAQSGIVAPLVASSTDFPGVIRAAKDLQGDLDRVTGSEPRLAMDALPTEREIVIIGTLGKAPLIDRLVSDKRLDVSAVAGKWETFVVQSVERPFPGVDRALVIAGSDKRGTIYGVYDLSAQIGVSPWTW